MRAASQRIHPGKTYSIGGAWGIVTSHILFAFKNNERISPVGLLLLIGLLVCTGICDNANL